MSCWIDFNRDGDWADAGEQVVTDLPIGANTIDPRPSRCPSGAPQGNGADALPHQLADRPGRDRPGAGRRGGGPPRAPIGVEQPRIGVAKRLVSADREDDTYLPGRLRDPGRQPRQRAALERAGDGEPGRDLRRRHLVQRHLGDRAPSFTVNPGFNGAGDTNLLAAGNTLAVGAAATSPSPCGSTAAATRVPTPTRSRPRAPARRTSR